MVKIPLLTIVSNIFIKYQPESLNPVCISGSGYPKSGYVAATPEDNDGSVSCSVSVCPYFAYILPQELSPNLRLSVRYTS